MSAWESYPEEAEREQTATPLTGTASGPVEAYDPGRSARPGETLVRLGYPAMWAVFVGLTLMMVLLAVVALALTSAGTWIAAGVVGLGAAGAVAAARGMRTVKIDGEGATFRLGRRGDVRVAWADVETFEIRRGWEYATARLGFRRRARYAGVLHVHPRPGVTLPPDLRTEEGTYVLPSGSVDALDLLGAELRRYGAPVVWRDADTRDGVKALGWLYGRRPQLPR